MVSRVILILSGSAGFLSAALKRLTGTINDQFWNSLSELYHGGKLCSKYRCPVPVSITNPPFSDIVALHLWPPRRHQLILPTWCVICGHFSIYFIVLPLWRTKRDVHLGSCIGFWYSACIAVIAVLSGSWGKSPLPPSIFRETVIGWRIALSITSQKWLLLILCLLNKWLQISIPGDTFKIGVSTVWKEL